VGGHNLGISMYSSLDKRSEAITVFKYLTSIEMQRNYIAKNNYFSPIPRLYNEKEVCDIVDCDFFKNIQLIARPTSKTDDYISYAKKFKTYIYEFLYGNTSALDALKKVDNITKVYSVQLNIHDSYIGVILLVVTLIFSFLFLGSLIFLYINKFKSVFKFLPNDFWFLMIFGYILMISVFFVEIGEVTCMKCHIKVLILSFSFTLFLIPILYKLIVCFPEENNVVSKWVNSHKYYILLFFMTLDLILWGLMFITPYTVEKETFNEGKTYQICNMKNLFGRIIICFIYFYKILIFLTIFFLIFIEWNLKILHYDIRFLDIAFYIDSLIILTFIIISLIKFDDYTFYFVIKEILNITFATNNYNLIYGFRIIWGLMKKKHKEKSVDDLVNDLLKIADRQDNNFNINFNNNNNNNNNINVNVNYNNNFNININNNNNDNNNNNNNININNNINNNDSNVSIADLCDDSHANIIAGKPEDNRKASIISIMSQRIINYHYKTSLENISNIEESDITFILKSNIN